MISDGLTQDTKVIDHALNLATVVADTKVALLEDAELGVELQNMQLNVAEEFSHEHEPCLICGLCRFLHDLMEFGEEGAEEPCHHDVVQSSPIDGRIGDIGEDVVVQGVPMKCEKHKVALPLVVGRQGFQNNHDHRSYVQDAGSLHV
jgi:hypothetical protein